jgi:hypothetical protein
VPAAVVVAELLVVLAVDAVAPVAGPCVGPVEALALLACELLLELPQALSATAASAAAITDVVFIA